MVLATSHAVVCMCEVARTLHICMCEVARTSILDHVQHEIGLLLAPSSKHN